MQLEFDTTPELTNTRFAPVGALIAYYTAQNVLVPLQTVPSSQTKGAFTRAEKLEQVVWSILTGCVYISEVNTKLRPERILAQVKCKAHFVEQSTLALALNELTQTHLQFLTLAVQQISQRSSRLKQHDGRGFLMLDFDLSGLPCGKQAEGSAKGYFGGKKTSGAANWRA